ncbi:MAG TPA: MtrB/PioB family decaheme-associated outer membrane protein [Casimicrobiaceae bacterium]|nr:MtrB/PioB family decaheme-associated outer membrane protein [Casimicrobiaceae bacterium]
MKTKQEGLNMRASVLATRAALAALVAAPAAYAADGDANLIRELTQPTSVLEAGLGYVTQDSFKFGEYNGLFRKGAFGILNLDVRGGGTWDSNDPTRWRIVGTDLGLEDRDLHVEYGQQGTFRLNVGYDELRRNRSDSFQTPYLGAGTDTLTLPPGWIKPIVPQVSGSAINFRALSPITGLAPAVVAGVVTQPTAAQQATVNKIIGADVPAFNNVDLSTKRKAVDGGFTYEIDRHWELKVSAKHERKEGLKPLGAVTSQVSEYASILPDPIDQTTDQYNVSLTFTAEKGFVQLAYYGSVFHNDIQSVTWQDANDPTKTATLASAPSNDFHQILLTGGYTFAPSTKLVLNASYGRNTQNDQFVLLGQNNQFPVGFPASSLNGLVVTKAFNAKLTSKPVKGLNLVAAYKFDDRDNDTPVRTFIFQDANEARSAAASPFNAALGLPANTLGSNINIYANRPYSKKVNQFDLDGNYQVARGQVVAAGYEYQQIDRQCDGSWINCADAPKSRENTGRLEWRTNAIENVTTRLAYAYSERRVDYDENAFLALVPMANVVPAGGATISAYQYLLATGLTGFGPVAGFPLTPLTGDAAIFSPNNNILPQALYGSRNNINEEVGMRRFNMADRNRHKLRGSVNWDANDQLSLQGSLEYNKDDYDNSIYGLRNAENWALNLEGSYAFTGDLSANAFYTHENIKSQSAGISYGSNSNAAFVGQAGNSLVQGGCFATVQARNNNAKIDPCLNWSTNMRDKVDTFGVGFAWKNLAAGKVDVLGDLVYADARTDIGVAGGSYANNPFAVAAPAPALPPGVPAVLFIPAADMPTASTKTLDLRLAAQYALDRNSAIRLLYWYEHLRSNDYIYAGMQFGSLTNVIPTNEQPFHYNVHVIGVSYIYRWQ